MERDPIVAEVRAARHRIFFEECGGDWKRFLARMKEAEKKIPADRLITKEQFEQRRRLRPVTASPIAEQDS